MKRTKLLALALAGVMALALLTGCSDSSSKAKQVEEYFRYRMRQFGDYQKDETLDKKLEGIAQQFQPSWLAGEDLLTSEAERIIKEELEYYLVTGRVRLWYGEVKPGQSALAQAESMKQCKGIRYDSYGEYSGPQQPLQAIAFTMTGEKSDGHRYYLALETNATIKTPQNCTGGERLLLGGACVGLSGGIKPLPLGEVALRSNDGEGKPVSQKYLHSDKHWLLSERCYRCAFCFTIASLPSQSRSARRGRVAAPSVCFAVACILLAAAPTAPPCFRRWRRSSPLPQRGSHWRAGPLSADRWKLNMA